MKSDIESLRNEYTTTSLDEKDVLKNPLDQFEKWLNEAISLEIPEPNAMILGTTDKQSQSNLRTVLLKGVDQKGLIFYTNYSSMKGQHIKYIPLISLLFPWYPLQRQVIICGKAEKISKERSEKYFHSRPRGSQLGALVSNQSERLVAREEIEAKLKKAEVEYENKAIPLPENWGGYLVIPTSFEFWQGRGSRLHDRIYFQSINSCWEISRLSP